MSDEKGYITSKVFGEIVFDYGWKVKEPLKIELFGKDYSVDIAAKAYYETEKITDEQETAFIELKKILEKRLKEAEKEIKEFYEEGCAEYYEGEFSKEELSEELTPKELLIQKDGECALLITQESDLDNGLAVLLFPEVEVQTQDEYL